ncbi:hypothetical protein [Thauera sp. Sel9]|uniref:hypothetical protein n=1 Tax=Thauera sp. Sel9 TaxID=2974299 RepID=UPI0021E191B1|nr:hypothetical protein [Thauera sp. Sel9]MCV2219143.1 hypothetical protein [Thauera sp. Sel9]
MGCCIFAVMIVGQIFEGWRRLKRFFGLAADDFDDLRLGGPSLSERLRGWLRRPALRVVLGMVLAGEAVALGYWVETEHGEHVRGAVATVARVFGAGGAGVPDDAICRADPEAVVAALPLAVPAVAR